MPYANVFLKRLGALLAEKKNTEYSLVLGLLPCHLNFALLQASVMCAARVTVVVPCVCVCVCVC